jgi:ubiquinone biosynthesis protein
MLKTMVTIETFARSLDPEFNLLELLRPYARRESLRDFEPKRLMAHFRQALQDAGDLASRLPEDVNVILNKFRQGRFQIRVQHEHLEALTKTLDKSSNRISFALIIAALLIGSSMLVAQENLQQMGVIGYMIAAVFGVWLLISIIRGGKL